MRTSATAIHTLKSTPPLITPNDFENHIKKKWSLVANKIFGNIFFLIINFFIFFFGNIYHTLTDLQNKKRKKS